MKNGCIFALANGKQLLMIAKLEGAVKRKSSIKKKFWCGSSAWLEYMPVTHGVAGSSPVRTAINIEKSMFYKINTRFYTQ